jgi:hypothetical protein
MSEAATKKKSVGKIISDLFTGLLCAFMLFLIGCQIVMFRSASYQEFGVPSIFGYSFMQVATDSMARDSVAGDLADSLPVHTGAVMKQVAYSDIAPHDIITFKSVDLSSETNGTVIVSHRVREVFKTPSAQGGDFAFAGMVGEEYSIDGGTSWSACDGASHSFSSSVTIKTRRSDYPGTSERTFATPSYSSDAAGTYIYYTCGDNLNAETCGEGGCAPTYREAVKQANCLGKIVSHSAVLGWALGVVMAQWFIPVACLIPLALIVTFSGIDLVKAGKKERFDEDREVLLAANKAGVDPNDERAYLLFAEKERFKLQVREEMEKTKAAQKKQLLKEMKKKGDKDKMEESA